MDKGSINRRIVVIGGGPGGYPAAIRSAQLGAEVILVEKDRIGGTCLHRGCIPTKTLLKSTRDYQRLLLLHDESDGQRIPAPDLTRMMKRKIEVVEHLAKGTSSLLSKNGIRIVAGTASFVDKGEVRIAESGEVIRSSTFIISTGSETVRPPLEGVNLPGVLDSDEILCLDTIPRSLAIIGGGVIGMEFAQIFQCLGTRVTVLEILPRILATEDEDVSVALLRVLRSSGIVVHTSSCVTGIFQDGDQLRVPFTQDKMDTHVLADKVLLSVGRRPCVRDLGIQRIGLRLRNQAIEVDEKLETNVPGVYAVGDVTGGLMLAHKATMEGKQAAENAAGEVRKVSYKAIPRVVYTFPEVACVGLTEEEARIRYGPLLIGRFPFSMNGRAVLEGSYQGFTKVIAEADTKSIVGVSIVGPQAGHLIGEATLAIRMEATLEELAETIHAHPTFSETLQEAALDAGSVAIHLPPVPRQLVG